MIRQFFRHVGCKIGLAKPEPTMQELVLQPFVRVSKYLICPYCSYGAPPAPPPEDEIEWAVCDPCGDDHPLTCSDCDGRYSSAGFSKGDFCLGATCEDGVLE